MSISPNNAQVTPEQLARLSHEFRTPLNGVLGMARLLEATRLTPEQKDYVDALRASGDYLLGLVNDFLDFASLGASALRIHPVPMEVESLLRHVCELVSPRAHDKGLEIAWAADADLVRILADEGRLRQILLNLVGNAVKFTATGGILVRAELRGSMVRFSVSDSGPGIPLTAHETVFEPFSQTEFGANFGGAGLGLAIVRSLALAMGGQVGVESSPGDGARVWIEAGFPVLQGTLERPLAGAVVAIASNSSALSEAAARQVEASGGTAISGQAIEPALEASRQGKTRRFGDIVLLVDAALLSRGRTPRPPAEAPAVVLLAPEQRHRIERFRKAGWAGYLIKPLRRASLVERVCTIRGMTGRSDPQVREDERVTTAAAPGLRVLLAEDNPINALLARTLLEREGCIVERTEDGERTISACASTTYDVVLMDLRMPGMGGLEASRILRQRGYKGPIIALTADTLIDNRRDCLAAGMDDFLVKPLTPQALRFMLSRYRLPDWTSGHQTAKVAS